MGPTTRNSAIVATKKRVSFGIPHMEWNHEENKFEKQSPLPPPIIPVKIQLMVDSHKEFGIHCKPKLPTEIDAVADTGCQTSTCGQDILKILNIPERYLIPTSHNIVGITDTRLKILGTLMLKITFEGRMTRQMV